MFITSARFIKDQIPGTTIRQLLLLYERELQEQGVDSTSVDKVSVAFTNGAVGWEFNPFYNKLSFFTKGEIRITDEGKEYLVDFRGDTTRIVTVPAIVAVLAGLVFFFLSEFSWLALPIACGLFALGVIGRFINMNISFPVYFTWLRNNIENRVI
jgi:hypothetical protein